MVINLLRYGSTPFGTFGALTVAGLTLHTVEQSWRDNMPFVSCVPAGDYQLTPHRSKKYGNTWALVNPDLQVYHNNEGRGRYAILLHTANRARELAGCIAPGKTLGLLSNEWAVMSSRDAMDELRGLLEIHDEHILTIRWALPQGGIYEPN